MWPLWPQQDRKLKELRPPTRRPSHRCAPEVHSQEGPTSHYFLPSAEHIGKKTLYKPPAAVHTGGREIFAGGRLFLHGLKSEDAGWAADGYGGWASHHASTVRQFTECLAAYFNGWEELSRDMSWEIIYVQHADSTPLNDWQGCDVVNSDNVSKKEGREIAAFWEKVRQYQVSLPCRDF
ncbi:putative retrotransposon hot spot protein (RHS,) [Trypanosoma cruzi]|uniref:Putative retrotransposon hot spot protein (RHS,) n=1 Tax=Trypanosoma cruzi TaxID=5693 RepID=A0A2V2UVE5_TRYCR|nr:putative retrotransposon hot spot protein (RHS,) [Trypanosoma cruzi]